MTDQDFQTALSAAVQPIVDTAGKGVTLSFPPSTPAEVTFVVSPTPPQA